MSSCAPCCCCCSLSLLDDDDDDDDVSLPQTPPQHVGLEHDDERVNGVVW